MPTACSTWHSYNGRDQSENNSCEWVTALQSCPDLVTAIAATATTSARSWKAANDNNLRWPFCRCARVDPGRVERHHAAASHWRGAAFRASLLALLAGAEQESTATYADLFWLLVSARPTALHRGVASAFADRSDCYPMDMDLPSAQRNTVVVSADGATLDYFEVQATLVEQAIPAGNEENGMNSVFMRSPRAK